jgi:hypothetical protein
MTTYYHVQVGALDVLSAVRDMSALECVRETLRLGLEALEKG